MAVAIRRALLSQKPPPIPTWVPAGALLFRDFVNNRMYANLAVSNNSVAGLTSQSPITVSGGLLSYAASVNLVNNPNTFTSGWNNGGSAVQNVTGPDGTANSGWTITLSHSTPGLYQQSPRAGGKPAYSSIYVKSNGSSNPFYLGGFNGPVNTDTLITPTGTWVKYSCYTAQTASTYYFELRCDETGLTDTTVCIANAYLGEAAQTYDFTDVAPSNTARLVVTFDDNSTQLLYAAPGPFTVPSAQLNRSLIKSYAFMGPIYSGSGVPLPGSFSFGVNASGMEYS